MTYESYPGPYDRASDQTGLETSNMRAERLRERGLHWGAMPLVLKLDGDHDSSPVIQMQNEVYTALLARIDRARPTGVPERLANFVEHSFMSRYANHVVLNRTAYEQRLLPAQDEYERYGAVFDGIATVGELLAARAGMGMASIELARVTHPYGSNVDDVEAMRDEVQTSIETAGGDVLPDSKREERFKLRRHDFVDERPEEERTREGLLFTRRRLVGMVAGDTRVMERTSFIVRFDNNDEFDPRLRKLQLTNDDIRSRLDPSNPDYIPLLPTVVSMLRENDFRYIIPLSTTTYAYNRTIGERIKEAVAAAETARRAQ